MMTRREAIGVLGSMSVGTVFGTVPRGFSSVVWPSSGEFTRQSEPALAPGAPTSPERMALIDAFKRESDGIETQFEARTHKSDWVMPYRLFRPQASGKLPLVVFLHGSGGQGTDNAKQMGLGNIFGTRVFALPSNQKSFPCHVVVPQTDRGWVNYGPPAPGDSFARVIPGLGAGAKLALEIVNSLVREFPIDDRRIYVLGQSMGGAGVWHMLAERPRLFAAAVPCCGSPSVDDVTATKGIPVWNFHGVADSTVPISVSRDRMAALRKAGGHPISTEYAGVNHNSWEWAFTEPALGKWLFAQRRNG